MRALPVVVVCLLFSFVAARCIFSQVGKTLICRGSMGLDRFSQIDTEKAKKVTKVMLMNIQSPGLCTVEKEPITKFFPNLKRIRVSPRRFCKCIGTFRYHLEIAICIRLINFRMQWTHVDQQKLHSFTFGSKMWYPAEFRQKTDGCHPEHRKEIGHPEHQIGWARFRIQ